MLVQFESNYMQKMLVTKKDAFWSQELLAVLMCNLDFSRYCTPSKEPTHIAFIDIEGPVAQNLYHIVVCGRTQEMITRNDITKIYYPNVTPKIRVAINVQFSVTQICEAMQKRPHETEVEKTTGFTFHKIQIELLKRGMISLNPELTHAIYPKDPASSAFNFYRPDFYNALFSAIIDKIIADKVDGNFRSSFPPKTNFLSLHSIEPSESNNQKSSYVRYLLEVYPWHQSPQPLQATKAYQPPEQLADNPICVVIHIPKNLLCQDLNVVKEHAMHDFISAIKIVDAYPPPKKSAENDNALLFSAPILASSMLSSILVDHPPFQVDTLTHRSIATSSENTAKLTDEAIIEPVVEASTKCSF